MPEYENRTKRELDTALRELLKQKPLEQIRIRELTEFCGLRRQSFYYHFEDVYGLFRWSVQRERELLLRRQEECLTWRQALIDLLDRAAAERAFYRAVLDKEGQPGLEAAAPLEGVLEAVQAYYRDRQGACPGPRAEALGRRHGQAMLLFLLEGWIRGGLALPPDEVVSSLERIVEQSAAGAMWQTLQERGEWSWTP